MKIALVAEHASPLAAHKGEPTCGASLHTTQLSRHLATLGHRVTVYSRGNAPGLEKRCRIGRGVTVEHLAAGPERALHEHEAAEHTGAFAHGLAARLEEDTPDVINGFGWTSGLAALSAVRTAKRLGTRPPIVHTFHSLNASEQRAALPERPDRARMEAAIAGRVGRIVVTSADQRFELARLGIPRQRVSVVPYGVDPDHFTVEGGTATEPWLPRKEGRHRVIAVTGLGSEGCADVLIDVATRLPEIELLIVAGPAAVELPLDDDARRLELLAKEAGVDDRVTLAGPTDRKELPRLLRSADTYVSAASYDPYGGAVLEAMACGLPVVATATGGLTDAVLDGTTGVLLRTGRPGAIARALRGLILEPTMRHAHGIAGADRARSRFTWHRVANETAQVYQRALSNVTEIPITADDGAHWSG
ncbi:glycosyltransferase involved in cell wall biosynthesis [Lipingzhangella halophila]|uniref:Glycosyltransferase involved in cell wall biosynthesis n=1 Tax=Lipingzhangella halophila TaxID=1783352 RepID=A0A7W7RCI0_9ACTN|nr:glycosyltransferase [Lipingzhangella halophila]MBB4929466.1 glycosyltransferase involved in cell wall biosynthesis [Lipingzhangella halophila]